MDRVEALIAEHDLRVDFPPEVESAAEALVAEPGLSDPRLEDLDALPFVTIDEVHSRDLDQALFVERDGAGFVAWYAIADAAHYVPPGSPQFAEALLRGSTYYFPGRVVPMLPRSLSEGIVSLNPGVARRALVWRMAVDASGHCAATTLHRARVRSRAKLDYDGVQAWFDGTRAAPLSDPGGLESLRALADFGRARLQAAESRGVVRVHRREITVNRAPDDATSFVALHDERNDVERFNEQLSLLCNTEGARWLEAAGHRSPESIEPIFRVHRAPGPELLARLEAQLRALVERHRLDPERYRWSPSGPVALSTFLARLPTDDRVSRVIHRQVIMMNRAATFETTPGPHHGVGASRYGRFSAPMREVVGVYLHQEVAQARGESSAEVNEPDSLQQRIIDAATRSRSVQRSIDRSLNRAALDRVFETASGPLPATVMGVSRGRVHVQLDDPPIDAKVYFRHLTERHGPLDEGELGLAALRADGSALVVAGQPVGVIVLGRDGESDRWALDLKP